MRRSLIYPKGLSEREIKRQHQRIFQNEREAWVIRMNKHTKSWAEWIHKSTPKHIIVTLQNTRERENLKSNQEDKLPIKKQRCDWQQTYHLHTQCLLLVKGHCKAVENVENGFVWNDCIRTVFFSLRPPVSNAPSFDLQQVLTEYPLCASLAKEYSCSLKAPNWVLVSCKCCDGRNIEAPEGKGKRCLAQRREVRESFQEEENPSWDLSDEQD